MNDDVEILDELTEEEYQEIESLNLYARRFTKLALCLGLVGISLIFFSIVYSFFPIFVKLALLSILSIFIASGSFLLSRYITDNNIVRRSERWI